jgi:pSer/pThr/pTyr-binding forkhead associated (FHA) protein
MMENLEVGWLASKLDDQEVTKLGDEAKAKDLPEGTMIMLRVLEGQEVGRGYPLAKLPVTLGRDALCDVSIVDGRLSRQHSMIFYFNPDFYIKDLGSTNGTFVNTMRIKQQVLKNGDEIKIGSTRFEFILTVSEPGAGR